MNIVPTHAQLTHLKSTNASISTAERVNPLIPNGKPLSVDQVVEIMKNGSNQLKLASIALFTLKRRFPSKIIPTDFRLKSLTVV